MDIGRNRARRTVQTPVTSSSGWTCIRPPVALHVLSFVVRYSLFVIRSIDSLLLLETDRAQEEEEERPLKTVSVDGVPARVIFSLFHFVHSSFIRLHHVSS